MTKSVTDWIDDLRRQAVTPDEAGEALRDLQPEAIPALIAALDLPDIHERDRVMTALRRMYAAALPVLIAALDNTDRNVRFTAVLYLGEFLPGGPGNSEAMVALAKAINDPDVDVRRYAVDHLSYIGRGTNATIEALIGALKDSSSSVRLAAAVALGKLLPVPAAAIPALRDTLHDSERYVQRSAILALGHIGPPAQSVVPELIELLRHPSSEVNNAAALAVARIGPAEQVAPALVDAVRKGDYLLRCKAAEGLGILRHGGAAVVETLAGALAEGVALRDPTAGLILATTALRALGRIGPDAVPTLAIALQSKRRQFRQLAAEMLGRMGPAASSTVPALILLLRDSSGRVRTMAALALGEMGKAAAPAIPVIEDAMSRFHIRDDAGASALSKIRRAIADNRG